MAKNGVKTIEIEYFMGEPEAVKFTIDIKNNNFRFRLPCNPHGVLNSMKRDKVQKSKCNLEQARRVSWRIIKDWIHSQVAIIDAGQVEFAEAFFPYMIDSVGETTYQVFINTQLQLAE